MAVDPMDPDDAETYEALATAFHVLGRFHLQPPGEEALAEFFQMLEQWPLAGTEPARAGMDLMRAARAAGESAAQIREDHAALYGTLAVAAVAPYESVHRGVERLVFDDHTLQVRAAYTAFGLRAPHVNREPDDHIGLEFDFVAQTLLRAAQDGDERALRAGADFWRDHLACWAPDMLDRVRAAARTRFMAGVAELSQAALASYTQALARTLPG